ncbi:MAG: ABC transporter ATP-binding protein [Candidatus Hydrogenedentes bacterium]|nr:ABC transporter ATP-binding protein [Candidatus Hydrogenedentota bacterium]
MFGLVGENGAGKTTLIHHLLGLLKAQAGSVRVFGLDPVKDPVGVLSKIGYLSEDRDIPDWKRVYELMRYTQAFYPEWDENYAEELRETFGLDSRARIKELSRGQRAQAGLLIALAYRPPLPLLDEPSSGLDAVVRRDILAAIIRTVADEGRTVVFSSHLLDEVERVADEVVMIHRGRLAFQGSMEDIKASHHRLVIRFPEPLDERPAFPEALACEGGGREWSVLCDIELDRMREAIRAVGAEIILEETPSLEDIFVARVGARRGALREA